MTKPPIDSSLSKSKGLVFLEYILLALCLCVIALRATFTEGPTTQSVTLLVNLGDSVYSLTISAVLIFSFVVWFVWSFCSRRFLYRPTAMEIGLSLLFVAAIIAGFAASNKRAAITSASIFLAPPLMAVLLVQILDSHSKIKLLLICIAALGVVSAYQCAEQFFVSNQVTIDQYEQSPQTVLEPLGIGPNTLQQFLFEHRLYSRGVRGFFTTRNSAGSFFLLASFAAIALFIDKLNTFKSFSSNPRPDSKFNTQNSRLSLLACGLVIAIILSALVLTRSKGALIGLFFAAVLFFVFLGFGNRLKALNKIILIVCLLLFVAGGVTVLWYGTTHDRLPGGNSMLVRWQYWNAAAKMYADHSLTGVGPGNFANFYPRYKPAEALESVADPHNFLLSILTQYGPLGLVGFLAMIFVPLWKVSASPALLSLRERLTTENAESAKKKIKITNSATSANSAAKGLLFLIVVSVVLLLVRPIIMPVIVGDTLDVMIYVIFTLYVAPVLAFAVGFLLLTAPSRAIRHTRYKIRDTNITVAALFCAVVGLLIHNLIDFAIFEPGVFTTFWAIIACLIVTSSSLVARRSSLVYNPAPFAKVVSIAAGVLVVVVFVRYAWWPVYKSTAKIQQAHQATSYEQFKQAHNLLEAGAKDDYLSSTALSLNGRLYLHRYNSFPPGQVDLLLQAERRFLKAIRRNRADFKNFEHLTEVYTLLADDSTGHAKTNWLNKAFDSACSAVERYPCSGRLRIKLAGIAEQLGKKDTAIENYKKAVEIEDAYRWQFLLMYPDRELFSRLGQDKYHSAKQKIKHLSLQPTP